MTDSDMTPDQITELRLLWDTADLDLPIRMDIGFDHKLAYTATGKLISGGGVEALIYTEATSKLIEAVLVALPDLLAHIKVLTDEAAQLRYERRLLGACRRHLDEIADPEGRYTADAIRTAGDLAQRIVGEIGHPVTDEPALGPEFRERIAELERDLEWAVAERDHALKQIKKPDYEKLVSAYLSGAEPVAEQRERMRPVVEAAQAWRAWFPHHDSMFVPENALIAAVDAYDTKSDGNAPIESPAKPSHPADARFWCSNCGPVGAAEIHLLNWESPHGDERCGRCGGGDLVIPYPKDPGHAPSVDGERAPAQPTTSED